MEQKSELKPVAKSIGDIQNFLRHNIPFSLDGMTQLDCSMQPERGLKLLTEAIRSARSLSTISFNYNYVTKRYMKKIIEALTDNTSVKTLFFYHCDTLDQARVEEDLLFNMLTGNKTLESIEILQTRFSLEVFSPMCEGLKYNNSVTSLSFTEAGLLDIHVELLADVFLANHGFKMLALDMRHVDRGTKALFEALQQQSKLWNLSLRNLAAFSYIHHVTDLIKSTQSLTDLKLLMCLVNNSEGWISFFESLQINTSLSLSNCKLDLECCNALGAMFKVNTTLQTLVLDDCGIEDDMMSRIAEGLKVNATLTHLSLQDNPISTDDISEVLKVNTSLKYLNLNNCGEVDPVLDDISDALVLNSSLTELHIRGTIRTDGMLNIGQVLEFNQSLRILHLEVPLRHDKQRIYFQEFLTSLKYNTTLTELNLMTDKPPEKSDGKLVTSTLKSNKAIRKLELFGLEHKNDVNRWLKRNEKLQRDMQQATFSFIKMIALRTETFLSIFPMEIWRLIFDRIKVPGVIMDFGELFMDVMTDPTTIFADPMETE